MTHLGKTQSSAGFTLIETLVAFAILSVAIAAAYRSFSGSLTGTHIAADRGRAILLAQSQLESAGTEFPLEPGLIEGREHGFDWSMEISKYPLPDDDANASRARSIAITINWRDGRASRSLSLETLRLVP